MGRLLCLRGGVCPTAGRRSCHPRRSSLAFVFWFFFGKWVHFQVVKPGRGKVRQKEQWRRSAERRQGSVGPVCCWVMCSAPKLCPRVVRECGHRRDARPETPDPTNLGNRDHLEAPRSLDFTETFRLSGFDLCNFWNGLKARAISLNIRPLELAGVGKVGGRVGGEGSFSGDCLWLIPQPGWKWRVRFNLI